jgi:hypothetical protein
MANDENQLTTTAPDAGGGALLNVLESFQSYFSSRNSVHIRPARVSFEK